MLVGGPRLLERLVEEAPPRPGAGLSPAVLAYLAEARQGAHDMEHVIGDVTTTEEELEESAGYRETLEAERKLEREAVDDEAERAPRGKGAGGKKPAPRRALTRRGSPPPKGLRRRRS